MSVIPANTLQQEQQHRLQRLAARAAGVLTVAVAVAACSGGSSTPQAATGSTPTVHSAGTATPSSAATPSDCVGSSSRAPSATGSIRSLPTTDPFYRWSGSLTHQALGAILRTRAIPFTADRHTQISATQLLYITTDELRCRTISVVTIFQPRRTSTSAPTRLLSYQTSYDALGSQCDPSYTLKTGTEGETGFITDNVAAGDTVVISDYEGEDAAYGVGQQSGYETLDAIRATETWLRVPADSTPVGMLGYSGGAVATEFASELAPTYVPHLDIVGAAEGGIAVDLFHNLTYIDHPSSPWTGQIPSYLDGLARGFDIRDLDKYFTRKGIVVAKADQTRCAGTFTGLTTRQLFKPRYRNFDKDAVFVRAFDDQIMSRSGTPRGPLFIGNGRSDSIGDGVTVAGDVQELAHIYCHRGVPVELHIYTGDDHSQAGTPFFDQAQVFFAHRFNNRPFRNGCSNIRAGNSIAPVPVPAA